MMEEEIKQDLSPDDESAKQTSNVAATSAKKSVIEEKIKI